MSGLRPNLKEDSGAPKPRKLFVKGAGYENGSLSATVDGRDEIDKIALDALGEKELADVEDEMPELRPVQMAALLFLMKKEDRTMQEVADEIGVTKAAISKAGVRISERLFGRVRLGWTDRARLNQSDAATTAWEKRRQKDGRQAEVTAGRPNENNIPFSNSQST